MIARVREEYDGVAVSHARSKSEKTARRSACRRAPTG